MADRYQTRCAFTIPGRPQRWIRPQQDGRRGKARNARFTDPKAQKHKDMVARLAAQHYHNLYPWTGPVVVSIVAVFAIPDSWPRYLQQAAREARVMHISDPDLDQLIKQVWDGVKGVVVVDDNQFCGFAMPTAKRYGHPERTEVVFTLLDQAEDAITPGQRRMEKDMVGGGSSGR